MPFGGGLTGAKGGGGSDEVEFTFIAEGVILTSTSVVGCVLNSLGFFVMTRRKERSRTPQSERRWAVERGSQSKLRGHVYFEG